MERRGTSRRFLTWLLLLAAIGLAGRCAYVLLVTHDQPTDDYDALYYELETYQVAGGNGFIDPSAWLTEGRRVPSADHPPLTVLLLAPVAKIFGHNRLPLHLTIATLGAINVVLIGLLAAEVASRRVALIAAGIAVVYPLLWVNDGLIMAETPAILFATAAILVTYKLLRRPSLPLAALLGVLAGLAALTRGELILLGPILAVGAALALRTLTPPRRMAITAVVLLSAAVVVAPWVTYNLGRFEKPVFLSTNLGTALLGTSCNDTFYGPNTGSGTYTCFLEPHGPFVVGDQSVRDAQFRADAVRYTKKHLGRYPVVLLARVGRDWSLYRPFDRLHGTMEGQPEWVVGLGLVFYYPLLILAIGGVVLLVRRRAVSWPLLVTPVIITLTVLVSFGVPRYRAVAEPSLVILGAVALGFLLDRRQLRASPSAAQGSSPSDEHLFV